MQERKLNQPHCCLCCFWSYPGSYQLCATCQAEMDKLAAEQEKRWDEGLAQLMRDRGAGKNSLDLV